ncbi:hypothetical protein C8R46DRAFT_1210444 [Mycena filopes]|nr:hypothetical protein C8R46DRAFT_1210444 [Mycena filopes]
MAPEDTWDFDLGNELPDLDCEDSNEDREPELDDQVVEAPEISEESALQTFATLLRMATVTVFTGMTGAVDGMPSRAVKTSDGDGQPSTTVDGFDALMAVLALKNTPTCSKLRPNGC